MAIAHRAVSVLDRHPIEQEKSPVRRSETAVDYLYLIEDFNLLRRQEEGAILCRRVLPLLEALYRDSPDNNRHRDSLLRGYHLASPIFLNLGDLAGALDAENKALKLDPPANSPAAQDRRALALAHSGFLELRLGHRDVAIQIWREALALFQHAISESEKLWSSDPKNLSALETLRVSEDRAAFMLEHLGDIPQALHLREAFYAQSAALLKVNPADARARTLHRYGQENAARELSLLEGDRAGDKADYRRFFDNDHPTLDDIRGMLVRGWRYQSMQLSQFGSPIPPRLEAAKQAVTLSRELVKSNPSTDNRVLLASSLMEQGDALDAQAHYSVPSEKISVYHDSRDCFNESLGILNSLKEAGKLPSAEEYRRPIVIVSLAGLEERLQGATLSTKAKQP